MALVQIDLEPHEFGIMFHIVDGCIVMEEPFAKLIELDLRKEFKRCDITHDTWGDGEHNCEEVFTITNEKMDTQMCIFITPMNADDADELVPELMKHVKYSSEWNGIWDEMKQLGHITVSLYKHGDLVDVPDEILEKIHNCVKKWTDRVTLAMI